MVALFLHNLLSRLDLYLCFDFFHLVLQFIDLGLNSLILLTQLVIDDLFVTKSNRVAAHFFLLLPFYLLELLLESFVFLLLLDSVQKWHMTELDRIVLSDEWLL